MISRKICIVWLAEKVWNFFTANTHYAQCNAITLKKCREIKSFVTSLVKTLIWRKNVDFSIKVVIAFHSTFPHCALRGISQKKVKNTVENWDIFSDPRKISWIQLPTLVWQFFELIFVRRYEAIYVQFSHPSPSYKTLLKTAHSHTFRTKMSSFWGCQIYLSCYSLQLDFTRQFYGK